MEHDEPDVCLAERRYPPRGVTARQVGIILWLFAACGFTPASDTSAPLEAAPPSPDMPVLTPRPTTIAATGRTAVDLNGSWWFHPSPPAEFWMNKASAGTGWSRIRVPGEWIMQGFKVEPNKGAGYIRKFEIPSDWKGCRIKLRADAVYSDATVWINGREAGRHVGGFTPFELDVTALVNAGKPNTIALAVKNESLADQLANGTMYAAHALGGITRKIALFAVPETHIAALHTSTSFDADYRNAVLRMEFHVINQAPTSSPETVLRFKLLDPHGAPVRLETNSIKLPAPATNLSKMRSHDLPISAPEMWDPDHPRLYTLICDLETRDAAGRRVIGETVKQRIGFREVRVSGNQLLINGKSVKLRGVCRHETDPLRGRSLAPGQWRKDAELFRDMNCNYIRTSHYPSAEEFLDACDEVGLLVEVEAPFCWAHSTALTPEQVPQLMTRQTLEMVEAHRNHPSAVIWSLGNESNKWREYFLPTGHLLRKIDPGRPLNFSQYKPDGDEGFCEIGNHHYPGLSGPTTYADAPRPIVFDEFGHLNSYNRRELVTDPGLRDVWGENIAAYWEAMLNSKGCLGGAIWAAIDDSFFLPSGETVGYGTWGPLDGWRRKKPEYWNLKKIYSPIRLGARENEALPLPAKGGIIDINVANRSEFLDLSELKFDWSLAGEKGTAFVQGPPGTSSTLKISSARRVKDGDSLFVKVVNPRGFIMDEYRFPMGTDPAVSLPERSTPVAAGSKIRVQQDTNTIILSGPGFRVELDAQTGHIRTAIRRGKTCLSGGPWLYLIPMNKEGGGNQMHGVEPKYDSLTTACTSWRAASVHASETSDGGALVEVKGSYAEAEGGYTLTVSGNGVLTAAYSFRSRTEMNVRQLGLGFDLPPACSKLEWRRKAQWSVYPEDHIGRPNGVAQAVTDAVLSGPAGPRAASKTSWAADRNELGSNDFRSTKMYVLEASLANQQGAGIRVLSNGTQHVRSWTEKASVCLLIADYANEGASTFAFEKTIPQRKLTPGSSIEGETKIELKGR